MTYQLAEPDDDYGPDRLSPLKGGRYSNEMHGPAGTDIGTLPVEFEPTVEFGRPSTITHSGWMPDEEQQRRLARGAHVRLSVWQHPIPPLAVSVEPPICQCHEEEMAWERDEDDDDDDPGGYVCRRHAESASAEDESRRDFTAIDEDPN